jgi:hypothetical protein
MDSYGELWIAMDNYGSYSSLFTFIDNETMLYTLIGNYGIILRSYG